MLACGPVNNLQGHGRQVVPYGIFGVGAISSCTLSSLRQYGTAVFNHGNLVYRLDTHTS